MAIFDDTRSAWGATAPDYPLRVVPPSERDRRVGHWAGNATHLFGKSHASCLTLVKAWQAYHKSKGWGDIGYNALCCVHARMIEGCGLGVKGAHCPPWNTVGWGYQFMVGVGEQVTPEMFARVARFSQDLEGLAGHDLDDYGHKESPEVSTECPGTQVMAWIKAGGPESGHGSPAPEPAPHIPGYPDLPLLIEDGQWGPRTTLTAQRIFKSGYYDGEVSRQTYWTRDNNPGLLPSSWQYLPGKQSGSPLIVLLQRKVGASADGVWGPATCGKFQQWLGTPVDHLIWEHSPAVKAFQRRLNTGRV